MDTHPHEKNRKAGWFWLYNSVMDWYLPRIGDTAFVVLCALARMRDRNDECFPGVQRLCTMLGKSDRTIQAALQTLERYRLVRVDRRLTEKGRVTSNLYTLLKPVEYPEDALFPDAPVRRETLRDGVLLPAEMSPERHSVSVGMRSERHSAPAEPEPLEEAAPEPEEEPVAVEEPAEIAPEEMARRVDHAAVSVPSVAEQSQRPAPMPALTPAPESLPVTPEYARFCEVHGLADPVAWTARFLGAQRKTGARRTDWETFRTTWTQNELNRQSRPQGPAQGPPQGRPHTPAREARATAPAPARSMPGNTSAEDVIRQARAYQKSRRAVPPAEGKI